MKRALIAFMVIVSVSILAIPALANEITVDTIIEVSAETTYIYASPSTKSEALAFARKGYRFTSIAYNNTWWKLQFRIKGDDTVYEGHILRSDTAMNNGTPYIQQADQDTGTKTQGAQADTATTESEEITATGSLTFRRNEEATISVTGKPNTQYSIVVYYSSGASTADGLHAKTSDANGSVSWTWHIGGNTNPGTYRAVISGGDETKEINFTIEVD